ncbi:MAG: cell division protein FtsZ [Anaerolineales bacterium]|nr:cell division protein FtsZ [Anaerolineales bacterium]
MNAILQSTSSVQAESVPLDSSLGKARIAVLGLGGGGSNAINRMIELGLGGVEFIAANTDRQALDSSLARKRLQLGPRVTRGLGAGGDPRIGSAAAMESAEEIAKALQGVDMVFITAGMGGGTGTGSAPVAAEIARELGILVVAIVTLPFTFEMGHRSQNALKGVRGLQPHAHTLITVPNDKLLEIVPRDVSLEVAFRLADDVLRQGVQGISELVTRPGLINVDFAHIRSIMNMGGGAYMAIGMAAGEKRAVKAISKAIHHPLLEIDNLDSARGVLVHFTGGEDLTLFEISEAVSTLRERLDPEADIILGATTDPRMKDRAQAILVVTGVGGHPLSAVNAVNAHTSEYTRTDPVTIQDLDLPTFLRRRATIG